MNIDDFEDYDDDFDNVPVIVNKRKLSPEHKFTLRKMIREAVRKQNNTVLFTCRECCFYRPPVVKRGRIAKCLLDESNELIFAKRMPTQLPSCFQFAPLTSAFADVLDFMIAMRIDMGGERGWASAISRVACKQDRYGYITGVTQRNLDKYGS